MSNWQVWVGNELEGNYRGKRTIMIDALVTVSKVVYWLCKYDAVHLWFCKSSVCGNLSTIDDLLKSGFTAITLEVLLDQIGLIPAHIMAHAEIIVEINSLDSGVYDNLITWVRNLKGTDSIRFTFDLFKSIGVPVRQLWITYPDDYKNDTVILSGETGQNRDV